MKSRELLATHGIAARVVSLPSWEIFERQPEVYRRQVLGSDTTKRLSIEAGTTIGWERYTGSSARSLGQDTYGASGPGKAVLAHFGFTQERVAAAALRLIGRNDLADQIEPNGAGGETAGEEMPGDEGHS
jgi:transketolase